MQMCFGNLRYVAAFDKFGNNFIHLFQIDLLILLHYPFILLLNKSLYL
jgi:hypothetical protein